MANVISKVRMILWLLSLYVALVAACGERPRDLDSARREAIGTFKGDINKYNIDPIFFQGPSAVTETPNEFVFEWVYQVPRPGLTIWEYSVPKDPRKPVTWLPLGKRKRAAYLAEKGFTPSETALNSLFELSINPKDESERGRRLRTVSLDAGQLEDVDSFVRIKRSLMEYSDCFNRHYPDSLAEIRDYQHGYCYIEGLDSLYTHDRYGCQYIYENLIDYVVLGSQGQNSQWDFKRAVIDSIYNDDREHIYVNGDDIIVKFKPNR